MSFSKFPKFVDYHALKQQFGERHAHTTGDSVEEASLATVTEDQAKAVADIEQDALSFAKNTTEKAPPELTGTRLRSYAFAVLTRREYSKADLIEKLALYAQNREEVLGLVEEFAQENYQSDQRVAEMTVRSQVRKGKGPNRIKLALHSKKLDQSLVREDLKEIDWYAQAYELKVKKYGTAVAKDPKEKAKQIRFLQYRGFEMDAIFKAISRKPNEDD